MRFTNPEALSIVSKTAARIKHIKRRIQYKHQLAAEENSQSQVEAVSAFSKTLELGNKDKPFKFERVSRKPASLLRSSVSAIRKTEPMSKPAATSRPLSASAWNVRVRRQQESDMTHLMNQHFHLGGTVDFKPMSTLLTTIDLHSKQYCRTLQELKAYKPTTHRESSSVLRPSRMVKQSSRASILSSSRMSSDNSYSEASNENNFSNIAKVPRYPTARSSSRTLPPRPCKAAAETQTERILKPLNVFGIVEDEEVESPPARHRNLPIKPALYCN